MLLHITKGNNPLRRQEDWECSSVGSTGPADLKPCTIEISSEGGGVEEEGKEERERRLDSKYIHYEC